ncbi:hypothetical protein C8Q75DRAFT_106715 [Abortiporus biennis]|nr:hypothetical protein C8Q75DRAFT_106715 [Abortiporus biennis]
MKRTRSCLTMMMERKWVLLHDLVQDGMIDLTPPYQRDVVWAATKQSELIDSIYRNFYVPPIVFAIVVEDNEEVMRCVDGKQRLTSIVQFIDGHIPYRDPLTRKAFWWNFTDDYKGRRNKVPDVWKQEFERKHLTCVSYKNLTDALEREIFQRVQMGVTLTPAEKLQAISSARAEWISILDARFVTDSQGLARMINIEVTRGRGFQNLAQLVYCCFGLPEQLLASTKELHTWLKKDEKPRSEFKTKIEETLTEFWHLATQKEYSKAFTAVDKRVAPLEFTFIGVVIFVMNECQCTHAQKAQAIYKLRLHIRNKFPDVRMRTDIIRYTWEYVAKVANEFDEGLELIEPGGKKKKGKKRARAQDEDEEDDEDEQAYARAKGKKSAAKKKAK